MKEDLDLFGISYWRTYHQIPGISHCIQHCSPLVDACENCGSEIFQRSLLLPSLFCFHCGEKFFVPQSKNKYPTAHRKTLELLKFLFKGNWKILCPEIRAFYYETALRSLRLFPVNAATILHIGDHLKKRWNVRSLKSLAKLFSSSINAKSIASALSGTDYDSAPLLHVLLLEYFSSTLRKIVNLFSISELESAAAQYHPPLARGSYELPLDKQRELISGLDRVGIARGVLYGITSGINWKQLCRNYCIAGYRGQQLDVSVPWFAPYRRMIITDKQTKRFTQRDSIYTKKRDLSNYREIARGFAEKGQIGWHEFCKDNILMYNYLCKFDHRFLEDLREKVYPNYLRRRVSKVTLIEACKARILAAISSLDAPTRTEIWHAEKQAMLVLSRECPTWAVSRVKCNV
ncbi:hypothetical protein [Paraburkholderia sp. Cpub6]|uniref:hypothetical protein n=1 Tax=Paraburkholderia sp. Cpub6 TaxID=2723094 RepID=UPI0016141B4F|nr:hypothetical protein [Paraburkholderia sp. Cpub6]MBB5463893.1 hypothetical protein [Paraburkholderia sp. Cpub6]